MGWCQGDMRIVHHPQVTTPGTSTSSLNLHTHLHSLRIYEDIWVWCQGDKRTVHHPEVQFTIPREFQGLYTLKLYHTRVEPPYDIQEPPCQCLGIYPVLRVCATLHHLHQYVKPRLSHYY
jgi:hypothetical protein